jgi:hypothetical protein
MRHLAIIPMLLIPAWAAAQTAGDQLAKAVQETQCTRPDRTLIKVESGGLTQWISRGSPSVKYDRQVKGFNDCTRVYVDKANVEIGRIRNGAQNQLDGMTEDATRRIRRIERQISDAIERVKAVNGLASVAPGGPDTALDAFPEAECKTPDQSLLIPKRGARDNSARERLYDGQIKTYTACMQGWIALAKSEISRIKADTEAAMKPVTADANRQILEIWDTILEAVKQADVAQKDQSAALTDLKAQLAARIPPPPVTSPQDSETVVSTDLRLPRSADQPTGEGDPDAISCRMRQQLPGSRLLGPEICKRNSVWASLSKEGKNISADGLKILDSERNRSFNPQSCVRKTAIPSGDAIIICSQGTQ